MLIIACYHLYNTITRCNCIQWIAFFPLFLLNLPTNDKTPIICTSSIALNLECIRIFFRDDNIAVNSK